MAFLKPKFKFGASAGSGHTIADEAEQQRNQELGRLYISTRAGKHFQKDVVKGVENFISAGHKQLEINNKLAEDCKKYGSEGPSVKDKLSKATVQFGLAKSKIEKERDNLHRALGTLVAEPLKAMANGSPLQDARQLKQKYDRLLQDAENQATEVSKRKSRENNPEQFVKLQAAEQKLEDINSAMDAMGNNALSAMSLVESQQQSISLQKILAMVEYERSYFQRVTHILDELHHEIESQVNSAAALPPVPPQPTPAPAGKKTTTPQKVTQVVAVEEPEDRSLQEYNYKTQENHDKIQENNYRFEEVNHRLQERNTGFKEKWEPPDADNHSLQENNTGFKEKWEPPDADSKSFYATATHDFEGEDVGELTISIGDEVLVRQVTSSGWSEGICNGQSGWFPSTYVKKLHVRRGGGSRSGGSR